MRSFKARLEALEALEARRPPVVPAEPETIDRYPYFEAAREAIDAGRVFVSWCMRGDGTRTWHHLWPTWPVPYAPYDPDLLEALRVVDEVKREITDDEWSTLDHWRYAIDAILEVWSAEPE